MNGVAGNGQDLRRIGAGQNHGAGIVQGADKLPAQSNIALGIVRRDILAPSNGLVAPARRRLWRNPAHGVSLHQGLYIARHPVLDQTLRRHVGDARLGGPPRQLGYQTRGHALYQIYAEQPWNRTVKRVAFGHNQTSIAVKVVNSGLAGSEHAIESHRNRDMAGIVNTERIRRKRHSIESRGRKAWMQLEKIVAGLLLRKHTAS